MDHSKSTLAGDPQRAREPRGGPAHEAFGGQAEVRLRDRPQPPVAEHPHTGALAFMAHELRTPLTAIIGMADLLRDSQLSNDQREMLDIMARSARALVELVNGVLDFEKLEAGKLQLEQRTFSPGDCVEECIDLLAASAARKRLDLACFVDERVPSLIRGDSVRLRQTLINLVGNAIKFSEAGQVVVTVTAAESASPNDLCELRFAVADSGPGIPVEHQGAIFERYTQAAPSTSRRFGGTGLGLPITARLVALMGGRLWLESEVGKGSTFFFTLPARLESLGSVRENRADPRLAGRRVLVVEDNPIVGGLLVAMLGRWAVEATLAPDLVQAVTALRAGAYDSALIDGEIPGLSAHADMSALGGPPEQAALPLVCMTNRGSRAASSAPESDGCTGRFAAYVNKPVRPARLRDALMQAFANAPSATGGSVAREGGPEHRLSGIRVLVTDDDPGVRAVLARMLTAAGAEVCAVEDGARCLSAARTWPADTVLLDASMPGLDGFEVCRRLKADPATRLVPVIIVTGLDTIADRRRIVEAGADGIIPKPFVREELLARVRSAAYMKQATDHLEPADEDLVVMARAVDGTDPDTLGHCERLSDQGARLAARIGMGETEVAALRFAGLVHDIGKVALPDSILRKETALDEREWHLMRSHPLEGERLCRGVSILRDVLPIIRHHHEKQDGSGYPDGLSGNEIPRTACVLQVVDVYDALTTARRYRLAESPEGALEIMQQEVDRGWWDPVIFSAFRDLVREDLHARRGTGSPIRR